MGEVHDACFSFDLFFIHDRQLRAARASEELDGSSSDVTETESGADETDSGDGASEEETEAPEAEEPTGEDLEGEIPGDNDETIESEIDDGGEPSDGV